MVGQEAVGSIENASEPCWIGASAAAAPVAAGFVAARYGAERLQPDKASKQIANRPIG